MHKMNGDKAQMLRHAAELCGVPGGWDAGMLGCWAWCLVGSRMRPSGGSGHTLPLQQLPANKC